MAHILKRLCLPVGSYVKEDGKKQTQYREIGVLMEFERDDGSCWQEVRLHADILSPSVLAFARGEMEKGSAMARVRLFDLNGTKKKPEPTTTVTSAGNFKQVGLLSREAAIGAVWLARHGSTSNGHAGLVTAISPTTMATIEANTSLDATTPAKEREGDWITTRLRDPATNGKLRTLGFISPADIVRLVSS